MSLFPFLAVLICTMGTLILLLVIIAHQARLQAAQVASTGKAEQQNELDIAREDAQWIAEQLKMSHAASESELTDARLRLGHVEKHMRKLRERIMQLEATFNALEQYDNQQGQQRGDVAAEIARINLQIAEAKRQLRAD